MENKMATSEASLVHNVLRRFVNSRRQMLVFQNLWKDLCAGVEATLLVPRHRRHLEGALQTAGSRPQGEDRGRQAQESKAI